MSSRNNRPQLDTNFAFDDQELSELAAPTPASSEDVTGGWRREAYLESRRDTGERRQQPLDSVSTFASSNAKGENGNLAEEEEEDVEEDVPQAYEEQSNPDEDLTELAAPRPAQDHEEEISTASGTWEQHHSLEERRSGALAVSRPKSTRYLTQFFITCSLIFYSLLGTLARLGVQWITFYPGAPVVISNLWANFGGSLILGFLVEDRRIFREEWGEGQQMAERGTKRDENTDARRAEHKKIKKTIPLFIGLTVGFCGSFTSFSTFARDTFLALANDTATPASNTSSSPATLSMSPRNRGYDVEALSAVIILTICVSLGGLVLGSHIATSIERFIPTLPFIVTRRVLDPCTCILSFGCWIGAITMACVPPQQKWRGQVLFALVFAPFGCLARFHLSLRLNAKFKSFPLGTFLANTIGVVIFAIAYGLQHARLPSDDGSSMAALADMLSCEVLQGIEDGFCGCLTTVSTWVLELNTLNRSHAYRYGAVSMIVALLLDIAIMGGIKWSLGFAETGCQVEIS